MIVTDGTGFSGLSHVKLYRALQSLEVQLTWIWLDIYLNGRCLGINAAQTALDIRFRVDISWVPRCLFTLYAWLLHCGHWGDRPCASNATVAGKINRALISTITTKQIIRIDIWRHSKICYFRCIIRNVITIFSLDSNIVQITEINLILVISPNWWSYQWNSTGSLKASGELNATLAAAACTKSTFLSANSR